MLSPATKKPKKLTKIAQKSPLLTWAEQTTSVQEHLDMSPTQGAWEGGIFGKCEDICGLSPS
jgi:hypothetical protein